MANETIFIHPAVWAAGSFLVVFLVSGLLVMDRPRKWWLLGATAVAAFVLFDLFGLVGFLSALGFKLWRARAERSQAPSDKKDGMRVRPTRAKKGRKN